MRGLKEINDVKTWFPGRKYLSSGEEDVFVINYFNRKQGGFLLDIAAADGVTGSNSFRLIDEYMWGGLLVEPNPEHRENLELLYNNVNEVAFYSGAIHSSLTEVTLQVWDGQRVGHSNIRGHGGRPIKVPAIDINTLLTKYKAPSHIDFVSLDIEGSEGEVLNYWPWDKYTVELWCIERATKSGFRDLLTEKNYKRLDASKYNIHDGNEFWALK